MTAHTDLVHAILLEFGSRSGVRLWKANTGAARSQAGALIRFGVPGQSDISGIRSDGRRVEIEVKTGAGRRSKKQEKWARMIENYNGIYVLARSTEDVARALD